LIDNGLLVNPGTQGQGSEPPDRLQLARGAAAGLSHLGKNLEGLIFFVVIDRNIKIAAAG